MNVQMARSNMVSQQVRPWHVLDEKVLEVLAQLPREVFVPAPYQALAYSDTDIPLLEGQHMLSPKVVGRALQAINLTGRETVLEVGTGTGYVTACLTKLAGSTYSVEIHSPLLQEAEKNLAQLGCRNVTVAQEDGIFGWEKHAPYDAIVVTGSYPLGVPEKICEQLKPFGGRLFAIIGTAPVMQAVLIERQEKSQFTTTVLFETMVSALVHAPRPKLFQF